MVYYTPILVTVRKTGCPSENLLQKLGFPHHFWVSRKSGNPVISSPGLTKNKQ